MVITGMKVFKYVTIFSLLYLMIKMVLDISSGRFAPMDIEIMMIISSALIYFTISQSRKRNVQKQKVE